jgi:hypothetical protein
MGRGNDWCILRTSAGRTLPLVASLQEAGLDAWSPMVVKVTRKPRGSKGRVERECPIMPTFVFARAACLPALAEILAQPMNPHPSFSIFRYYGRIPLVADREIAPARAEEERARKTMLKKTHRHAFPVGEKVRVTEGVAAGMSGVVEAGDGSFALVAFGSFQMKIATFLLGTDEVQDQQPMTGIAA